MREQTRKKHQAQSPEKQLQDFYFILEYIKDEGRILKSLSKVTSVDLNYTRPYSTNLLDLLVKTNNEKIWQAAYKKIPAEQQLFAAASFGWADKLAQLIGPAPQVNRQLGSGASALYLAALYGRLDCVRSLIKANANVNCKSVLYELIQENKTDAIHVRINHKNIDPTIISPLCAATQGKHHEVMELLLEHRADVFQLSPYGFAYEQQCYPATEELVTWGASNELHPYSAMHIAAGNNDSEALALLMKYGAPINYAASFTESSCCGVFSTHCSTSTPLHHALATGSNGAAQYLIDHNANVNQIACDKLPRRDSDNVPDDYNIGRTPLQIAAKKASVAIIDSLLDKGACINTQLRAPHEFNGYWTDQDSALNLAFSTSKNLAVINRLMQRGARLSDWNKAFIAVLSHNDIAALDLLFTYRPQEKPPLKSFLNTLIEHNRIEFIQKFIEHGVKISPKHVLMAKDFGHEELEKILSAAVHKEASSRNRFGWFTGRAYQAEPAENANQRITI